MQKCQNLFFCLLICLTASLFSLERDALSEQDILQTKNIREPAVAGRFYPGTAVELRKQVKALLDEGRTEDVRSKPIAIISPHAGYQYSGSVAAYGYRTIVGYDYKRVIVIAPSHYSRYIGASILDVSYYKTPLGLVKLAQGICNNLINNPPMIGTLKNAHMREHSLETQLPFLQETIKDFELIPILVSKLNNETIDFLAEKIKPFVDEDTLIVVSSDFTHYGPAYDYVPKFKEGDVKENIKKLDQGAFERILAKDLSGFIRYKQATRITACGFMPIALLLKLLPSDAQGKLLQYDTSGNQTGNFENSVSYASIVFTRGEKRSSLLDETSGLSKPEQETLLKVARETLDTYVRERRLPDLESEKHKITQKLNEKRGVFVTLNKNGNLRGCIGHIIPRKPLILAVMDNTVNSSTNDVRFGQVNEDELEEIEIDISVLSAIKKIDTPENFIPGKHGIIIRKLGASAVFLPQVATEQGWNREDTLCHLCKKAGLPSFAWQEDDMEFFVFSAEVFHENRI
ncbi:MAG: AmmeMemoRadiSam system protein B [Candidatus Scalindua sp. AMX11]|nr:MAG: AmmeMemoRadiSam system protein B [Candidatus Scalindua sp.]NOG85092.1 AmmeMemoRadiSam system protein B [Planctomycetota bacterium]RZV69325.1 MAG: AmmeMemoRadiSam system protein B [Candidatus Scalindua sp. SCAELEC01]TDE66764.1 MAG: AmmeMemoRadiSam system protein B [Candidatus Scalindua sp. AMX11]GJQ60380.1 MAG: MEMO1 family protein [Candidatus Scalindua sp.]